MGDSSGPSNAAGAAQGAPSTASAESVSAESVSATPPPSFVKQAMRNMVRKGSKSLFHFGLTAVGFLGFIVLVAWLGRPTLPQ